MTGPMTHLMCLYRFRYYLIMLKSYNGKSNKWTYGLIHVVHAIRWVVGYIPPNSFDISNINC